MSPAPAVPFADFDFTKFWADSAYAMKEYTEPPPSDATVAKVERRLKYRLPRAYVALAKHRNGGTPARSRHPMRERTTWAADHIAINGIFAIGGSKPYSLLGQTGSQFWVDEWGYPPIGIYFADCPSGGHDMLCLDYRQCGANGEPQVVHVDQEWDYKITVVAPDFESFIRGLQES